MDDRLTLIKDDYWADDRERSRFVMGIFVSCETNMKVSLKKWPIWLYVKAVVVTIVMLNQKT